MISEKSQVLETRILEITEKEGPEGRSYREIWIEYPDLSFLPGQFVMVKKALGPTCWAYPYMLQEKTENAIKVYAVQGSSLFEAQRGIPLLVWGANGRGIFADQDTVIVSQTETAFFATPFLHMEPGMRHILIGERDETCFVEKMGRIWNVGSPAEAAAMLQILLGDGGCRKEKLIFALNVSETRRLLALLGESGAGVQVLAPTRISCGVGGCKGCHLHSKELKLGTAVCCSGPFLPGDKIDFEADKRCFHVFE